MAPGISTGHDGVVVVTDRRLLFVGLRHTLQLPYAAIQDVTIHGRRLGTRLIVSTLDPFYHHGSNFMPATTKFLDGFLPWARRLATT